MDVYSFIHEDCYSAREIFTDYYAAASAAQKLKIKSEKEYFRRYREHALLPKNPPAVFKRAWLESGGWTGFLGNPTGKYLSWEECAAAARRLGCRSKPDYDRKYKQDPLLPSHPEQRFGTIWKEKGGWPGFLGRRTTNYYPNFAQAAAAARRLGIKSKTDYPKRYKKDLRLPSVPWRTYAAEWKANRGWSGLLGTRLWKRADTYPDYYQAQKAAISLGYRTRAEYKLMYKRDPRLPSDPGRFYQAQWKALGGWPGFLQNERNRRPSFYPTLAQAALAVRDLGIQSSRAYAAAIKARLDPRLPSHPNSCYPNEWAEFGKWLGLFGRKIRKNEAENQR